MEPSKKLEQALVKRVTATGTRADVESLKTALKGIRDATVAEVAKVGLGAGLLDYDEVRGTFLEQYLRGNRCTVMARSDDASEWPPAAEHFEDAMFVLKWDTTPSTESQAWFVAPDSKGEEAQLYSVTYEKLTPVGGTLAEVLLADLAKLESAAPRWLDWSLPVKKDFARLSAWPKLERLGVGGGELDAAGVKAICALPELRALELRSVEGLNAKLLEQLQQLQQHPRLCSLLVDGQEKRAALDSGPLVNRWGSEELKPTQGLACLFVGKYVPAVGSMNPRGYPDVRMVRTLQHLIGQQPGMVVSCVGGFVESDVRTSHIAVGIPVAAAKKTAPVKGQAIAEALAQAEALPADFWATLGAATGPRALRDEPLAAWLTVAGKRTERGGHSATLRSKAKGGASWEARTMMGYPLVRIPVEAWKGDYELACGTWK